MSVDDLPGLPLDCVLATEAFAAQAKFDLGEKILLVPVGRAEIAPAADDGERQVMRSRPSLPQDTMAVSNFAVVIRLVAKRASSTARGRCRSRRTGRTRRALPVARGHRAW